MNPETLIIDPSQAALFGYLDGLQVRQKPDSFDTPELAQAYEVAYQNGLAMRGQHWRKK